MADKTFTPDLKNARNPYYALFMFPYPSAEGLHIGNFYAFICTDVMAKYKKLNGFDVFEPFGFDSFGMHLENYALKINERPVEVEKRTTVNFRAQVQAAGLSCDYTREVDTTRQEYYKWTQWIFTKLFERGMAYQKEALLNWCPSCQTVLADEQIEGGVCERCKTTPEKKTMKQWFFRITKYAQRMLDGLDDMDWSEITKSAQKNWIGRSDGARVKFHVIARSEATKQSRDASDRVEVEVFTTRPDTLFGATYFVLSPEHPLVKKITTDEYKKEVEKYIKTAGAKSELERTENKEKTGVFTGAYAINPVNNEKIPVWIADYVMMGYGTGAIMAVPAHDERDFEFAKKYNLPIKQVVAPDIQEYNKTNDLLKCLEVITNKAENKGIKFWLLGGLACAFHVGVIWRDHGDLDLVVKDNKEFDEFIKLIEEEGFKKIKEKEIEKGFINSIYKNKDNIEIDIGKYTGKWDLQDKDFTEEKKELNGIKSRVLSFEFIKKIKNKQAKERKLEKDLLDKKYLEGYVFSDLGIAINSDFLDGLETKEAKKKIIKWLKKKNLGKSEINYRLRDWCISRQRYWGPPVPIIYCEKCGVQAVPESDLPVLLPELDKGWEPAGDGRGPLAKVDEFMNVKCPKCSGPAKREADVMDNFLDSAWYFFRYITPANEKEIFDKKLGKKWLPIDLYVGGNEHAVLHLMYTRFITMFFCDLGLINFDDPFKKFRANGMILKDGKKMSKSKGNVINPEEYGKKVGYDALKTYLLFLGPLSEDRSFTDQGVRGTKRWIEKIYKLEEKILDKYEDSEEVIRKLHQTIKVVQEDFEVEKYNTAIARLMELSNVLSVAKNISKTTWVKYLVIIAPFAPALAEELWSKLGNKESIFTQKNWPGFDSGLVKEDKIQLVIQVNGKLRDTVEVSADISEAKAKKIAQDSEKIRKWIEGKEIVKIIFVKGKLVNIVIK